jgi:hypothetical protein
MPPRNRSAEEALSAEVLAAAAARQHTALELAARCDASMERCEAAAVAAAAVEARVTSEREQVSFVCCDDSLRRFGSVNHAHAQCGSER